MTTTIPVDKYKLLCGGFELRPEVFLLPGGAVHVFLRDNAYDDCVEFAKASAKSNRDAVIDRGQDGGKMLELQITDGKMGECAVFKYIRTMGERCSGVDFNVYDKEKKSFDHDLRTETKKIHVKSQNLIKAKRYRYSWIFQFGSKSGARGHFDKEAFNPGDNDCVAFCTVVDKNNVIIWGIYSIRDVIKNKLMEATQLERLKDTKKAVYLESLINSGIENWVYCAPKTNIIDDSE